MDKYNLSNFIGGWIIGDFIPSIINTKLFEIAIKKYKKGDYENKHFHQIAVEITIIVSGKVKMNDTIYNTNDIIYIKQNESTDFLCLDDTITCVIKLPSCVGDKYND